MRICFFAGDVDIKERGGAGEEEDKAARRHINLDETVTGDNT